MPRRCVHQAMSGSHQLTPAPPWAVGSVTAEDGDVLPPPAPSPGPLEAQLLDLAPERAEWDEVAVPPRLGDRERPARPQHPVDLADAAGAIGNLAQDRGDEDGIEARRRERQPGAVALHEQCSRP